MQYSTLTQKSYQDKRYDLIKLVEENNEVKFAIYDDGKGNNSIGIGMNLEGGTVATAVTNVIADGFDPSVKFNLNKIIANGHALSASALQSALNAEMALYSNAHPELGLRTTYTFANEAEVKTVFLEIAKDYESTIKTKLPAAPDFAQERLVYFSLAYNQQQINPLIGANHFMCFSGCDFIWMWVNIQH